MLLINLVITLILLFALMQLPAFDFFESGISPFPSPPQPPIRYDAPNLYPTTGPVDMLTMKKFLIFDGYRFQNSLVPPASSNDCQDFKSMAYPGNYRQRTGNFKEKAFVEKFQSGGGHGGSGGTGGGGSSVSTAGSLGTNTQLKNRDDQDIYLIGRNGDPIKDSGYNGNPFGSFSGYADPGFKDEQSYKNKPFSWGDVIFRFYMINNQSKDIVI